MQAQLIALDWGTSSLRAYKLGPAGVVLEQRSLATGIMHLPTESREIAGVLCTDGFELAFDSACGDWLDAQPRLPVIACGMVGSAQGWSEAAYRSTPVDVASLGQALHGIRSLRGVQVHIVPGVIEQVGLPNVMRGEETQVLGVLQGLGPKVLIGLPGSHSKWVEVVEGRITHFDTFMTGEVFAVLSKHSILGRTQQASEQFQAEAFDRGVHVALSNDGQRGVLSTLFSARTLGLTAQLAPDQQPDYLSGLLIGHGTRRPARFRQTPADHPGRRCSTLRPLSTRPRPLRLCPRQPGARSHRAWPVATGASRRAYSTFTGGLTCSSKHSHKTV